MAKIPFTLEAWLKDKSQKVETRGGRIVHNIWQIKEPLYTNNRKAEVCALIDGEEDALVFFEGGKYLPTTKDTDNPFDLFLITPEPELSEFEKKVYSYCDGKTVGEELIKRIAVELLDLARKQLVEEQFTSDVTKTSLYKLCKAEALKEIEQDPESSYAFKRGVEYGKAEALKDLPRWKKAVGYCFVGQSIMYDEHGLYHASITKPGCRYITGESLGRLPGFNE